MWEPSRPPLRPPDANTARPPPLPLASVVLRCRALRSLFGLTAKKVKMKERKPTHNNMYMSTCTCRVFFCCAAALALERHVADASAAVVLDAGAGTGQVGEHLSRLGFSHVLGVDLSAPMLRIAATKGCYRELLRGDLTDRTLLPPGSLDAVVCVGTLTPNHVEDGATLHTWLEWLRPGGVICASIRDDFWEGSPLPNACQRLQEEGLWTLVEETESARYTPLVNDVAFRVRTWRKAVDCLASGST